MRLYYYFPDNYNGSLMVIFFFHPLDVRMRKKQAQQQQPPPEDLQQEVEILKGNSFTLSEIAFSKFDIKRHIKQIQTEHIRKRQIVQEAEQFKKCLRCFLSGGGGGGGVLLPIRCWGAILLFKSWPKTLFQTNIYPYLLKRLEK